MFSKTNVISTSAVKHNQIKLPVGLAKHPDLEKAIIKVEGDHVTFTLPPKTPMQSQKKSGSMLPLVNNGSIASSPPKKVRVIHNEYTLYLKCIDLYRWIFKWRIVNEMKKIINKPEKGKNINIHI
jgi:hypothetical protein